MRYIIAGLLVLFTSYADIFLFRMGIVPKSSSVTLIPLFLIVCVIRYPLNDVIDIIKSHSFRFLLIVLVLSIVYGGVSEASSEIIISDISLNIITLLLYVFAVHFFRTEDKKLVTGVLLGGLFVLGGSLLYDFFIGLPKYSLKLSMSVRKGGFGENPNQAASGIKFLALAALSMLTDSKVLKPIVIIFMFLTVFLTFSRSGLASVILILIFGSINNWNYEFKVSANVFVQRGLKLIFIFIALYISLFAFALVIKDNFPAFTRGTAGKRIDLLLGQTDANTLRQDAIEGGRGELFAQYIDEFIQNPFGYGTGYTTDRKINNDKLNTHNYYLYLAINMGVLAFIAFLVFVLYNLKLALNYNQFYYFIFAMLFIIEGFITHNLFYERTITLCLAFFDSQIYKKSLA